jgi:hypothetical protein
MLHSSRNLLQSEILSLPVTREIPGTLLEACQLELRRDLKMIDNRVGDASTKNLTHELNPRPEILI